MIMKSRNLKITGKPHLIAVAVAIFFALSPQMSLAQPPKTFTEFVTDTKENDLKGEQVFAMPYLTNDTHYGVLSDAYSSRLYNVSEGMFCILDNNCLKVWSIDGEYLFGPDWKPLGSYNSFPMQFDHGALIAKAVKKNNLGKEYYSILYKDGSVTDLDPSWEPQSNFVDGLAGVIQKQGYRELGNFFINTRGEKVPSPSNLVFGYGSEGKTRAMRCGMRAFEVRGHKWGYMDANCQVVLQPQWDQVRDFSEGYAWTFKNNGSGGTCTATLIDKSGKVVVTLSSVPMRTDLSSTYLIGDVCDGKYYVYTDGTEPKTTYYDLHGKALAESYGGTSFFNGHALVRGINNTCSRVFAVDSNFNVTDSYPTSGTDVHKILADELWQKQPFEPFGLYTIHSKSAIIDSRGRLVLNEMDHPGSSDHIRGFSQPGKDGYIVASDIYVGDQRYLALIKYTGEIAWLFGQKCFTADDLKGFIKSPDFDDGKVIVDCPPTTKKTKGPTKRTSPTYKVSVVCNPPEGGTASVVGKSAIKYGDQVSIKALPAKDWAVTSVKVGTREVGTEPFDVTDDVTATVTFLQKPDIETVDFTNSYQGNVRMKLLDDNPIDVTLYATMSKDKDISSPFGDHTYGYIALMMDPKVRHTGGSLAVNIFCPPMKIVGFQREGDKRYLVADAGSIMYHDLRVVTNNPLANVWFNLMLMMDVFESGKVIPRRYRIEMLQVNDKTGECTLGNLQVFSSSKGWVAGQDKSLMKHTPSKFPMLSGGFHDYGLPADLFSGCTLKVAKKRDDVNWYPPLEWAEGQSEYKDKVEVMRQTYLHFITDCEKLFGK